MAEALQRAEHALCFAHGHIAHDGKPEHAYPLDFSKELRFIDETLTMAGVESKQLDHCRSAFPFSSVVGTSNYRRAWSLGWRWRQPQPPNNFGVCRRTTHTAPTFELYRCHIG